MTHSGLCRRALDVNIDKKESELPFGVRAVIVPLSLFLLAALYGCADETAAPCESLVGIDRETLVGADRDILVRREEIYFESNSDVPFTGRAIERDANGNVSFEENFKDGRFHGPHRSWHRSGQLQLQ